MIYDRLNNKKSRKIRANPDRHIPNKSESKMLRYIMASTGLTEKEVRGNTKYVQMLVEASKSKTIGLNNRVVKWYKEQIKFACRKTGLVPKHMETIKILQERLNDFSGDSWHIPFYLYPINKNAESVVELYAKK